MTQPAQRPPRRRKKKEPLVILVIALFVALVAWPFEKLFGHNGDRNGDRDGDRSHNGDRSRSRSRSRSRGAGRARLAMLIVVVAVVALLLAAAAVDAATGRDAIHGNVMVYSIGVGGLTVEQAAQKLERVAPRGGGVRLTWRGRGWNLSAAALHARLNARAAARDAYDYTRTGGFLVRGWRRLWLWFGSHSVDPQVSFAEPLTRERLDTISQAVDVKPVQGAVTISGTQP
ncbi:MAG: peptidoglycan binding domain-containing protein, partial [Thermoleophilia bacterium]